LKGPSHYPYNQNAERVQFQAERLAPLFEGMARRRIAAHDHRPKQSRKGRYLNDGSEALVSHRGQRRFGHGHGAERIRVELKPQLVEFDVFGKPRDGKARMV
jgi:hypothetical protein